MKIGVGFPLFKEKFHWPSELVSQTDHPDGIFVLRKIGEEIIKAFSFWIPTHDQSQTKRLTLDEPFHVELSALPFGKLRDDGLKIAILTGGEPLAVFTIGIDDTGIEMGCAPHDKEAILAVDVAQIGQVEVAPVSQEH